MTEPAGPLLRAMTLGRVCRLALVLVLAPATAWGRPETLKVRLLSATPYVQPGRPLLVGLHFQMRDHWHIYWTNPGDSGVPPQVRWQLPPGFQAGGLQWPVPERLGSGSVIDYGYQGSVVLPVEIQTPSATLRDGDRITFAVEVTWLACKERCVPGKASLTLTLPVRAAPGPVSRTRALFQEAVQRLPKPMPAAWKAEATSAGGFLVLTVLGVEAGQASFFPLEPDQIDNAAPQTCTAVPGGLRLTLKQSEQLAATPARLDGVLVLAPGRAHALSAPVRAPSPPAQ